MAVKKKFTSGAKSSALGRGLDALISTEAVRTEGSTTISEIPVEMIEANPNQPRREFDEVALQELANSISEIGIIQPITLHQISENRYMIIAGERRWRATQKAGIATIPAYVRTLDDASIMTMALVENIQREDLNDIEVALAYQQIMENEGITQEKVAQRVGKSRTAVTNSLRLLRLPAQVQMALQKKDITMGHARALLALDSPSLQVKAYDEIVKNDYNVRQVEEMVQRLKGNEGQQNDRKTIREAAKLPKEYEALRDQISKFFGTKIQMAVSPKGKGKISIGFNNAEELEHIMNLFDKMKG